MGIGRRFWSSLLAWSAWIVTPAPSVCSSLSAVVMTEGGGVVPGATILWNGRSVCVPSPPHGTPICVGSTVRGSSKTASDGSFTIKDLLADTYTVCVYPPDGWLLLSSCEWSSHGGAPAIFQLGEKEELSGIRIVLRSGSRVALTVEDPMKTLADFSFRPFVVTGEGSYYFAAFDDNRKAYIRMVPKGVRLSLFFDTLLVVRDEEGKSVPVTAATLPFQTDADEVRLRVSVLPSLVNAASLKPGITQGTIATLFGTNFTDTPGVHTASGFPLPTQLAGTSVAVNGIAAPLLAVAEEDGRGQINFQVPYLADFPQRLAVVVDNNGKQQTFFVRNWSSELGIFGTLAHDNGDAITETDPARPGEAIKVYWTGLGGFNVPHGVASPPSTSCAGHFDPKVEIGGIAAEVVSCTAAPGLAGIGQVEARVPAGLASGNFDVAVRISNVKGNVVRLPVR